MRLLTQVKIIVWFSAEFCHVQKMKQKIEFKP